MIKNLEFSPVFVLSNTNIPDFFIKDLYFISYTSLETLCEDLTLYENIMLSRLNEFDENCKELSNEIGIYEFLNKKVKQLSSGQKKLFLVLKAFLSEKKVIVIEDFVQFLDEQNTKKVIDFINKHKKDKLVILTSSRIIEVPENFKKVDLDFLQKLDIEFQFDKNILFENIKRRIKNINFFFKKNLKSYKSLFFLSLIFCLSYIISMLFFKVYQTYNFIKQKSDLNTHIVFSQSYNINLKEIEKIAKAHNFEISKIDSKKDLSKEIILKTKENDLKKISKNIKEMRKEMNIYLGLLPDDKKSFLIYNGKIHILEFKKKVIILSIFVLAFIVFPLFIVSILLKRSLNSNIIKILKYNGLDKVDAFLIISIIEGIFLGIAFVLSKKIDFFLFFFLTIILLVFSFVEVFNDIYPEKHQEKI